MREDELRAAFDRQAAGYDEQWEKMAPIREAERAGYLSRCTFHEDYLDSLPTEGRHHAATCFLVSQFILDPGERSDFFRAIANGLRPGGLLAGMV